MHALFSTEKFRRVLNSFLNFRDEQEAKFKSDPSLCMGDVTTVNFTMARGEKVKEIGIFSKTDTERHRDR